jgi:hypothetical protein
MVIVKYPNQPFLVKSELGRHLRSKNKETVGQGTGRKNRLHQELHVLVLLCQQQSAKISPILKSRVSSKAFRQS